MSGPDSTHLSRMSAVLLKRVAGHVSFTARTRSASAQPHAAANNSEQPSHPGWLFFFEEFSQTRKVFPCAAAHPSFPSRKEAGIKPAPPSRMDYSRMHSAAQIDGINRRHRRRHRHPHRRRPSRYRRPNCHHPSCRHRPSCPFSVSAAASVVVWVPASVSP